MPKREIIEINRDLCNGCGLCTTACAEGALALDRENKAVLLKEIYCDGLGACLDVCPTGALKIVQRETAEYDSQATLKHVVATRGQDAGKHVHGAEPAAKPIACGCPGSMARTIEKKAPVQGGATAQEVASELTQWPIQLHLISPYAPYFNNSDLLIAADCTAFALGSFHPELLRGKKVVIACPKLDDTDPYVEKLAELIKTNTIYSLTVAIMSVPCCSGLYRIAEEAVKASGKNIAIRKVVINPDGSI
ncbi:MAG: 4Fe-4S dicluster domain-containing protein [Candidatus Margulisiibacteriota bacterium]